MSGGFHVGGDTCCGFHLGGQCGAAAAPGSGLSIGDAIGGSTFTSVLFVDGTGKAANAANFQFNGTTLAVPKINASGQVRAGSGGTGSAATPDLAVNGVDKGLYDTGADSFGLATAGVGRWKLQAAGHLVAVTDASFDIGNTAALRPRDIFSSGHVLTGAGAAATPSLGFDGDPNTGLYNVGADRLGVATGGVARWEVSAAGHLLAATDASFDIGATLATRPRDAFLSGHVLTGAGAAATPAHTFDADPDTGLWNPGANRLGLATAGVARWEVDASGNLLASTDNSFDIGANAATRPKDCWLAGNLRCVSTNGVIMANSHQLRGNGTNVEIIAGNGVVDTMVKLQGRLQAATATGTSADVFVDTTNTRTAGFIFQLKNNTTRKWAAKFDGRIFSGLLNSAPTDADLQNSEISWYLDEATPAVKARIKKSDGTFLTLTITNGASPTLA